MLAHLWVISSIVSSLLTTRCHRSLLERGIYTVDNAISIPNTFQPVQQLENLEPRLIWFVIAIVHYDIILSTSLSAFHGKFAKLGGGL